MLGGHAGYNWQYSSVVAGLEIDFSAARINGSSGAAGVGTQFSLAATLGDDVKYLGTARTRLGWAPEWSGFFGSGLLIYGTAGLAWERVEQTSSSTFVQQGFSQTFTSFNPTDRFGWVAGVGVETKIFGDWILGVEYLHYDFGHTQGASVFTTNFPGSTGNTNTDDGQRIEVVRGRLSYKFCGGCR